MFTDFFTGIFVLLFGLIIGSFLNVVVLRLEKGEGFVKGRSYCPHCKHPLTWLDLFPVLSFAFLLGKCRHCRAKISWQYPLVEIATGLVFWLMFSFQAPIATITGLIYLIFLLYVASSLIVIFVYDLKYYLIPDAVLFPAIFIALIYRMVHVSSLLNYGIAVLVASGFFLGIFLVSRGRWMGFGDVKLAILLGLLLGFPHILAGLFLSFFFGAIIGTILIALSKKGLKSEVPFAPFLIIGTLVAMLWGSQIIQWYSHFLIF